MAEAFPGNSGHKSKGHKSWAAKAGPQSNGPAFVTQLLWPDPFGPTFVTRAPGKQRSEEGQRGQVTKAGSQKLGPYFVAQLLRPNFFSPEPWTTRAALDLTMDHLHVHLRNEGTARSILPDVPLVFVVLLETRTDVESKEGTNERTPMAYGTRIGEIIG